MVPTNNGGRQANEGDRRKIGSVETAFEIIENIRDHDGMTLTELSAILPLSTSTVHDYLSTMVQNEYLVKEDNTYELSLNFLDLGTYSRSKVGNIVLIENTIDELSEIVGARAQFIVEEYGRGIYIYYSPGEQEIRTAVRTGGHIPLHSAAAGKVILANLPEERVHDILDRKLEQVTTNTMTDQEELLAELEEVRENGYGLNLGENTRGLAGIGAPVLVDDQLLGAVSVAPPIQWVKNEDEREVVVDQVLRKANELELKLADKHNQ